MLHSLYVCEVRWIVVCRVRQRNVRVPDGDEMARVASVKEFTAWKRRRAALVAFPVALLGFLLMQIVLLPAHGLPAHDAVMSGSDAATSATSLSEQPQATSPGHGGAGHAHADEGHGSHDGAPVCHAPHYADAVPSRFWDEEFTKLGLGVLPALTAGMLAVSLVLPRPPSRHRRWCSRPLWRPAGADLLSHVCIART